MPLPSNSHLSLWADSSFYGLVTPNPSLYILWHTPTLLPSQSSSFPMALGTIAIQKGYWWHHCLFLFLLCTVFGAPAPMGSSCVRFQEGWSLAVYIYGLPEPAAGPLFYISILFHTELFKHIFEHSLRIYRFLSSALQLNCFEKQPKVIAELLAPSWATDGTANGKQYGRHSQTKNRTAVWPRNSTSRFLIPEN